MLKFKNKQGSTVFKIKDDDSKPKRVEDVCPKCQQSGDPEEGEFLCSMCGRPIECEEEEK